MRRRFLACYATGSFTLRPTSVIHPSLLSWDNVTADPGPEPLPPSFTPLEGKRVFYSAAWKGKALLNGTLPYGRFTLTGRTARQWCYRAGRSGLLLYTFTRQSYLHGHDEVRHDRLLITAARHDTYDALFDLDTIISDYRQALPPELAEREIEALIDHRARSPADHLGLPDALSDLKRAVCGLTLGHPIALTTALIVQAARRMSPEVWQTLRP